MKTATGRQASVISFDQEIPWAKDISFLCPNCAGKVQSYSSSCRKCKHPIPTLAADADSFPSDEVQRHLRSLAEYAQLTPKHPAIKKAKRTKLVFGFFMTVLSLGLVVLFSCLGADRPLLNFVALFFLLLTLGMPYYTFTELRKLSHPLDLTSPIQTVKSFLANNEALRFQGIPDINEGEKPFLAGCCLTPLAQKDDRMVVGKWIECREQLRTLLHRKYPNHQRNIPPTSQGYAAVSLFPETNIKELEQIPGKSSLVRIELVVGLIASSERFYLVGRLECCWPVVTDGKNWLLAQCEPPLFKG